MHNLEKDEAISLEDERFTECRAVKLYYAIYGRNAWKDTWIKRYFIDGCMNYSFEVAKQTIEPQRVQGSVFYIEEIPALQFLNSKLSVIVTEINSETPLQRHHDIPEGLAVTLCEIFDFFDPLTDNSVIRLLFKKRLSRNFLESIEGASPLKRYESRAKGADYPLGWQERQEIAYRMSSTTVEMLVAKFDALIPPFETPNMDKPVGKLGLSPRTTNALQNAQIMTLRDLMSLSEVELLRKQNMGRKSVYEIIDVLSSFGQQLLG
jgi:hypothetical protein